MAAAHWVCLLDLSPRIYRFHVPVTSGAGLGVAWFTCDCPWTEAMLTTQLSSILFTNETETNVNSNIISVRKRGRSLLGGSAHKGHLGSKSAEATTVAAVHHAFHSKTDSHPRRSQRPTRCQDLYRHQLCSIVLLLLLRAILPSSTTPWFGLLPAVTASATKTKTTTTVFSRGQRRQRRQQQQPATTGTATDAASQRHRRTPKRESIP